MLEIFTVNVFLIVKEASVKSTFEILAFASGVYKVLSETVDNSVVRTFKSVTSKVDDGRNPLEIPATAVVVSTVKSDVPTLTTLAKIGSLFLPAVVSVYSTISFSLIKVPGNRGFLAVMVLIPPDKVLTVAMPTLNLVS